MIKSLYTPPKTVRKLFSNFVWESSSDEILLTFDDGPIPSTTELILKELSKHKIKALFFCVGNNIRKYPSLTEEIISEGHSIGNHTFNHQILMNKPQNIILDEIVKVNDIIEQNLGLEVKYFRPPHGRFPLKLRKYLSDLNMVNVMWSLLTTDYNNKFSDVKFAVDNYLNNNSIVVLHDSLKSKDIIIESINYIHDMVEENNFKFGDVASCLK